MLGVSLEQASSDLKQYAIMIDAGSTGSRAFIYQYRFLPDEELPIVRLLDLPACGGKCMHKIGPGIADLAAKPEKVEQHLSELLSFVSPVLTELGADESRTKVYFQATGGARTLSTEDSEALLATVRASLSKMKWPIQRVEVITGDMEGAYSWINVNYLSGHGLSVDATRASSGVLEMGGESMQIVFETDEVPQAHGVTVKLGSHTHMLYSYGYAGLGGQAARARYKFPDCAMQAQQMGKRGTYSLCRMQIQDALTAPCTFEDEACGIFGVYQPGAKGVFLAIDHITNNPAIFRLEAFSASSLDAKAESFCDKSWEDVKREYYHVKEEHLENACFEAAYISVLLEGDRQSGASDNLGFMDLGENIRAVKTIQGQLINWTLGSLIYHLMNG